MKDRTAPRPQTAPTRSFADLWRICAILCLLQSRGTKDAGGAAVDRCTRRTASYYMSAPGGEAQGAAPGLGPRLDVCFVVVSCSGEGLFDGLFRVREIQMICVSV